MRGLLSPLESLLPVAWQELTSQPFRSRSPALSYQPTFSLCAPAHFCTHHGVFMTLTLPLASTVTVGLMNKTIKGPGTPCFKDLGPKH